MSPHHVGHWLYWLAKRNCISRTLSVSQFQKGTSSGKTTIAPGTFEALPAISHLHPQEQRPPGLCWLTWRLALPLTLDAEVILEYHMGAAKMARKPLSMSRLSHCHAGKSQCALGQLLSMNSYLKMQKSLADLQKAIANQAS